MTARPMPATRARRGKGHFRVTHRVYPLRRPQPVQRHRLVNQALGAALCAPDLHAVSMETLTPEEVRR